MEKQTTEKKRVLARVYAEDLRQLHGGATVTVLGPEHPATISEAATSESIPDER